MGLLTTENYVNLPEVPPDRCLAYGDDPEQYGHLYLPTTPRPWPVVVLLHGGCWQARYGLRPLGRLCAALREEGFAVWNLEYRRLGGGGGWPETFRDVAAGTDFLKGISGQFGIELSSALTVGHSAGGHLALWLAGRQRLPEGGELYASNPLPIRGVVALAGIPDLGEGVRRGICWGACQEIIGGSPEEVPERYRSASPAALLPLGISQRHIIGSLDSVIPIDYLRNYVAEARKKDDVTLTEIPGAGHIELVVPAPPAWPAVLAALADLRERQERAN